MTCALIPKSYYPSWFLVLTGSQYKGDLVLHFAAFFTLSSFALRFFTIKKPLTLLLMFVLGLFIELCQSLLSVSRQANIDDILLNSSGILTAAFLHFLKDRNN